MAVVDLLSEHVPKRHLRSVAVARSLAKERFADRADGFDRDNRFPSENYEDLREAGLLALTVPEEYGGMGVDSATYVSVLSEIARGCAATGLTFNMHCAIVDFLRQIGSEAQKARYFGEIVGDGAILASITSEPASSFRDAFRVKTAIRQDGDGYRLEGRKAWCSLSTAANYYFTWSRLDGSESLSDGLLNVMVPADRAGITVLDDWDTVGMRATASNSIDFDGVRIEAEEVIGTPGIILTKDLSFWSVGYTAVYVGIAEAAYAYCIDYARNRVADLDPSSAASLRMQAKIGELSMIIDGARRATEKLALLRGQIEKSELTYILNQSKYLATEAAHAISVQGMRMLGGTGISRGLPMQQYLRDAMAGLVMPPANDRCLETVGKIALGLDAKTLEFK